MLLGKELHGPENAVYVGLDSVSAFSELIDVDLKSSLVEAAKDLLVPNDVYPAPSINEYISSDKLQGVFFADGSSVFGSVQSFEGELKFDSAVYRLRAGTSTQVSLELVPATELAELLTAKILYWENLKPDGQISTAVLQYEAQ